jgi:hypothetical protein
MDSFVSAPFLLSLVLVLAAVAGFAVYLAGLRRRLAQEHRQLLEAIRRHENELAGLSLAGCNIDRILMDHKHRLGDHQERVESLKTQEFGDQSYQRAIDRIRAGATAESLVSELGLSLSEAGLLVRLHAASQQERGK